MPVRPDRPVTGGELGEGRGVERGLHQRARPADPVPDLAVAARDAAGRAAAAAGVEVATVAGIDGLRPIAALFDEVWGTSAMLPVAVFRALEHAGSYVAAAVERGSGALVGGSIAFYGRRHGVVHLRSHITGVLPRLQGRAVGFALKQHQRAWALEEAVETVEWTFDPIVRRNAYFNLTRLGARVVDYHADFYGPMDDAVNAGEPTDRCVARWELGSPEAVAAAAGAGTEPDLAALRAGGATVVLEAGADGLPVPCPPGSGTRLVWVPADVVGLRAARPDAARAWRYAVREALGAALGGGYDLTGATRSGWYVLTRRERS